MSEKFLSIIIPFCQKDILYVLSLLKTIDEQQDINWDDIEIICSASSTNTIPHPLPNFAHYIPKFVCKYSEINGPGISRNLGIKESCGKYLIMLDADDTLKNNQSLHDLMNNIRWHEVKEEFDAIMFRTLMVNKGQTSIIDPMIVNIIPIVLWHYVLNREFIMSNNLMFREDCYFFEDVYYMCRACELSMRIVKETNFIWYVHVNRDDSAGTWSEFTFSYLQDVYVSNIDFLQEFPDRTDSIWAWFVTKFPNHFYETWEKTNKFEKWSVDEKRIAMAELKLWAICIYPQITTNTNLVQQCLLPQAIDIMNRVLDNSLQFM